MSQSTRAHETIPKPKNPGASAPADIVPISDILPVSIPLLPVSQTSLFPGMVVPFILPEGKLVEAIDFAQKGQGYVGVVISKTLPESGVAQGVSTSLTGLPTEGTVASGHVAKEDSAGPRFHQFGVAGKILKRVNLPDNQISVLVSGLQRFELQEIISEEPHLIANVKYIYDEIHKGPDLEAMIRSALTEFKRLSKDNPLISEEVKVALVNIDGPGKLADFMASVLIREVVDYQNMLSLSSVKERLQYLLGLLKKERDVQSFQQKMQDEISSKVHSAQREFFLQEQLKYIQKELGRYADERGRVLQKFRARLEKKTLSSEAKTRLEEEFEKIAHLHEQSSEYSVSVNYLDWATALPWGVRSEDSYDLAKARKILDQDHWGLKEIKTRLLEFLAVKKLKKSAEGTILCFVGPPGTGKTSLGRSIATALNRKFFRFSVGGMRDEAEIKGHRRTYVGAMPGKIIQGLKRVGTQNPVFLIDEIDKLASGWASGGDPASALLEVLDPEQNGAFLDHYLDIPYDLSEVFFIATANSLDTIPAALLDRMEIIPLAGYTDLEKKHIAIQHLIPKLLKKTALPASQFRISEPVLKHIIEQYARESGVRNLEKQLEKLARKVAYKVATGSRKGDEIKTVDRVEKLLGIPPFRPDDLIGTNVPGVVPGLAWTSTGGDVLFVESTGVEGRGGLTLTGTLGKVMQESANIAYTFVRGRAAHLALPRHYFDRNNLHLHVPNGATPKDGPSAGITMAASLYSYLSGKALPKGLAMTGELSLSGRVLPVGGIKEKLLAAKRAGFTRVILPQANEKELREIDPEIRKGIEIRKVSSMDEVLLNLFGRRVSKPTVSRVR